MKYKIAIIGEAWGQEEALYGRPFIGSAGQELNRLLADTGLLREECFITNVFNLHPEGNDLANLCVPKSGGVAGLPALLPGKYLQASYAGEIDRLFMELEDVRPNLALLLGNTACWAVLGVRAISKIRGTCRITDKIASLKCLPTYHPSAILRQYELRHVTVLDFLKAKRESEFPELRRPAREIWIEPTLDDLETFHRRYLDGAREIAFDIETASGQITCIGFAPTIDRALVVPFVDTRKENGSYWSRKEEGEAWAFVRRVLASPARKLGQNTLYDIQYLWQKYGIPVSNYTDDTMLLHHALQPESPKGLAFLGSVYTNEPAWKAERPRGKEDFTIKRED